MKLYVAKPSGFCAGVQRAVDTVKRTLREIDGPVYVRHQIVHNAHVVSDLKRQNAIFVEDLDQVPENSYVIFSAHGSGRQVHQSASNRGLQVIDATCPLVKKVHTEIQRFHNRGLEVVLIGDPAHPEVIASADQSDGVLHIVSNATQAHALIPTDPERLAYVTQTTLSVDDCAQVVAVLRHRFPSISSSQMSDICYAAQNRQAAVKLLAQHTRNIVVVGSSNSSNAKRLREVAWTSGAAACLLDDPEQLHADFLAGATSVGLAAGASSPQDLIDQFVARLRRLGVTEVEDLVAMSENIVFPLPAIRSKASRAG